MVLPMFPASDAEHPDGLMQVLGDFWSSYYAGRDLIQSLVAARGCLDTQTNGDLAELLNSAGRTSVPVFHVRDWCLLSLLESQLNQATADYVLFDSGQFFDADLVFDGLVPHALSVWALPPTLHDTLAVTNRIGESSRTLVRGIDFVVQEGAIWFVVNPFNDSNMPVQTIAGNLGASDRECDLWLYGSTLDTDSVYNRYGSVVQVQGTSSQRYKDFIIALYNSMLDGGSLASLGNALQALTDIPLARAQETVQQIFTDYVGLVIVTDQNVYRVAADSTVLVNVGTVLEPGDALIDALELIVINRGSVPARLERLALPQTTLTGTYSGPLIFVNTDTDLNVDQADVSGYTKIRFALDGDSDDITQFWDTIHSAGVTAEQTLAVLLDRRPTSARDQTPGPLALPAQVNPLVFLLQNVFRNNVIVVKLKPADFGADALGLTFWYNLRRIVSPQVLCIGVITLTSTDEETLLTGLDAVQLDTLTWQIIVN